MNEKDSIRRQLKIYSILIIIVSLVDSFVAVIDLNTGAVKEVVAQNGTVGIAALYVVFGIVALLTLAGLWMGFQGLRYVKGVGKGKSHVVLATIAAVLMIFSLVSAIIEGFTVGISAIDTSSLLSYAVSILTLVGYIQAAKPLLKK